MSQRLQKTQALLARHHRDGNRFAKIMKETFAERFDERFWKDWARWIEPVYSERPVVLDMGSGPGLFVRALVERYPGIRAVGIECASYMLNAMEVMPAGAEVLCHDLHDPRMPLADASVDAAMASVVLHEMSQPVKALLEARRCVRPGGRLYISDWVRAPLEVYIRSQKVDEQQVFDPETPVEELDNLFTHFIEHNRFSREDLIYMLNQTGFAILDSQLTRDGRFARLIAERHSD